MKTLHSAQYAVRQARLAVDMAREACAHWDYESDPDGSGYPCCFAVQQAREAYRSAKRICNRIEADQL